MCSTCRPATKLPTVPGSLSSSEPAVHFGLGADTVIKRMDVTWPSGQVQTFENLPVDQRFLISARYFGNDNPPARTLVGVPTLAHPGMLIEIEGVAAAPAKS